LHALSFALHERRFGLGTLHGNALTFGAISGRLLRLAQGLHP
jgi:hypothetical protein